MNEIRAVLETYRSTESIDQAAALCGWTLERTRKLLRACGALPWTICVQCGIDNDGAKICPNCRYCRPCGR